MKELLIQQNEQKFSNLLVDSAGKKFTVAESIQLDHGCTIKKIKSNVKSGFFYQETTTKTAIVVHATVGVLSGDIATLTNASNPVSVPYVIARDGSIYELFDPKYWAYHLGKGTIGGNKINSSRSIGIELSNMGPLKLCGTNLETIYSRMKVGDKIAATDVYCGVDDTSLYTKLESPYRGYQYFSAYTDAQYKSLNILVRKLSKDFNIPLQFLSESKRFNVFTESESSFHGVCAHVNFRGDGKCDVGPDFKWEKIINDIPVKIAVSNSSQTTRTDTATAPSPKKPTGNVISSWKDAVSGYWKSFLK